MRSFYGDPAWVSTGGVKTSGPSDDHCIIRWAVRRSCSGFVIRAAVYRDGKAVRRELGAVGTRPGGGAE